MNRSVSDTTSSTSAIACVRSMMNRRRTDRACSQSALVIGGTMHGLEDRERFASDQLSPLSGSWQLVWEQAASQWNMTDRPAETRYVVVQQADAPYPPAALTGGMPGLGFEPIVAAIQAQGLFPP
jgi:hypothetical protein